MSLRDVFAWAINLLHSLLGCENIDPNIYKAIVSVENGNCRSKSANVINLLIQFARLQELLFPTSIVSNETMLIKARCVLLIEMEILFLLFTA